MTKLQISRRKLLLHSAAIPLAGFAAKAALAEEAMHTVTPRQTEGPFYPRRKPQDIDNDLAAFDGAETLAEGELLALRGRVLDQQGNHISGVRVEIWHCDQLGKYHHVDAAPPLDDNFQGYGETLTDGEGNYGFRTIKPGVYPGRTRHIHFNVFAPGRRALTSQMYFDDEMSSNLRDGIYRRLSDKDRAAVTMKTRTTSTNSSGLEGMLDIVLA